MNRCVIYLRVSSKEQVDNTSLESQEAACRRFAQQNGWDVVRVFIEPGESAKSFKRPVFLNMVQFCSEGRNRIGTIVFYKFDRWMRNSDYSTYYRVMIEVNAGCKVASATEPFSDDFWGRSQRRMIEQHAEWENVLKSERTKTAMKAIVESGRLAWNPPRGYIIQDSQVRHSQHAADVRHCFEQFAAGAMSVMDIQAYLRERDIWTSVSKSSVHRMLRNPTYCGLIASRVFPGRTIKADLDPIVSEAVFDRVQLMLNGRIKSAAPKRKMREEFPLRGFARCACCGRPLTAGFSRGRSGARYGYYECINRCSDSRAPMALVEQHFIFALQASRAKLLPALDMLRIPIATMWKRKTERAARERLQLDAELVTIKRRSDALLDAYLDQAVDPATFKAKGEQLQLQRAEIATRIQGLSAIEINPDRLLERAVAILEKLPEHWQQIAPEARVRFERALFPGGLSWSKSEGFRTAVSASVFNVLPTPSTGNVKMG